MKNRYLKGLYELLHYIGNPDPELGVMFCVIFMQIFFILDVSIIFQFRIPLTEELGNKWIVRLVSGSLLWLINKYIFGIRERVYSKYPPLSKRTTLLITLIYFAVTIGFLFYSSKNPANPSRMGELVYKDVRLSVVEARAPEAFDYAQPDIPHLTSYFTSQFTVFRGLCPTAPTLTAKVNPLALAGWHLVL